MYKRLIFYIFSGLHFATVLAQTGSPASALTEQDFLGEMPIVLSVSRLAQRLDETPGAVTILDRQFIRMTGARDVVDVLRLVPGFQTTNSFETDAPMATYHGRSDEWANRIQVLVDGRSVYSGYLQGSAGLGWQTLAIDDIERIEVLRGSNSATYGARAFLGVVNIISRDVHETDAGMVRVNAGNLGIVDAGARLGWGDTEAAYRVSVDSRGDEGLRGAFGKNRSSRVNFASHFSQEGGGDLDVHAGDVDIEAGRGDWASVGNFARVRFMESKYLQVDWRKALSDDQDVVLSASRTENINTDSFPYLDVGPPPFTYYGITLDSKGHEFNDVLSVQHTVRQSDALRTVWGAEVRHEQIISRSSFDLLEQVSSNFTRVFGSAEWRLTDQFVLNAGALAENSDIGGGAFSPRLMLNWHVAQGHTLRVGSSTAFRPPSAFEKYGAVRYYDINGLNPTIYFVRGNGQLTSEKVVSRELGYYFNLSEGKISGDLRVFNEAIENGIGVDLGDLSVGRPASSFNGDDYVISGTEYQVSWRPSSSTQVFFNQTWTDIRVNALAVPTINNLHRVSHGAPKYASALTVMHTLPNGLNLTLLYQQAEKFALTSDNSSLFNMERTDVRVGKPFRLGATKAELAVTIQNLNAPYLDGDKKFYFDRRAMVSLRFEN